jgi:gamma-glutamylputrescine oxidase
MMMFLRSPVELREHTHSYYAATLNSQHQYPTLDQSIDTDICIIGGGFTGVNTALELVERGFKVVLLEANRIGWGATGRNGGQIIGGIGHSHEKFKRQIGADGVRLIQHAGWECCEIIRERVAKYNIDCDLTWGYADVAIKPRHLRDFEAYKCEQEKLGYPFKLEMVDADTLRQQHVSSDNYLGGLINRDGYGHVHSLNLCRGEAKAASDLGATIFEQTRVVKVHSGDTVKVETELGQVTAKFVVHCGNAYMGDLQPKISKKILPATSCVIATEPLGAVAQQIMPSNIAVCDPRTALDYCSGGYLITQVLSQPTLLAQCSRKCLKCFLS